MIVALPLAGKTIVITRPVPQSAGIAQRLKSLGATIVGFPLIAIEAPLDKQLSDSQLRNLTDYDTLIFTSRNAVDRAFSGVKSSNSRPWAELFTNHQIAAVGKQTAEALEKQGITVSIVPDTLFNSEALLAHDALQNVASQRIAIIRGEGGRDLLQETLVARGANVEYIDVYRRICPVSDLLPLVKCQDLGGIDIIMLTSAEGLINLFRLGAEQDWLKRTTLLVGSQRIADAIDEVDHYDSMLIAADPSDDQMVNCLLSWVSNG